MEWERQDHARHYLEQHYLDVIDFYKHSHLENDYIPLCVYEKTDHELEAIEFRLEKNQKTKDITQVISEFQETLNRKKTLSWIIIYHTDREDPRLEPSRKIESANAFKIMLMTDTTTTFILPYEDRGEEIIYSDLLPVEVPEK